ncbi:unnamed protein product [Kuraishia capsulata CBS 1993]|uniref:Uncharacterized protein n=1 Tax=Kuraishia capsulata CBS 1993 TaxID=1382522 RepID=W6MUQ8_9ASCO|nr:uncharacterized protein KUCA_T00005475001 [Kuraishia capsulata CBS 1993]CDK29487.1 unnamed protein product [Kuraishia capsulata CBS 1993]
MSGGPVPVYKKYTTGSKGIWELIRKTLTLVPNRSSGNPLVKYFRVPAPGSQPLVYKDTMTVPAGDIKGNQYSHRDHRRNYPQLSSFDQTKVSALLSLGSAASPRISIGTKGQQELEVYKGSELVTLSSTLSKVDPKVVKGELLGPNGEAVVAPNLNKLKWRILEESESGMYSTDYPVRTFAHVRN